VRILLSNDDGVDAPGLAALRSAVGDLGEVTVVAPVSPQSAAGHAITVYQPLEVRRLVGVDVGAAGGPGTAGRPGGPGGPGGFPAIAVDGRPADCVRLAIRNLLSEPPELVLSGLNHGANVGINVFYSGTVAAAAEGAMFGIPAVALSAAVDEEGNIDYPRAAALCRWVLDRLLDAGLARGDLFNVNIPPLTRGRSRGSPGPDRVGAASGGGQPGAPGASGQFPSASDGGNPGGGTPPPVRAIEPRGVRFVPQSTAGMEDIYHPHADPAGRELYRLGSDYRFDHQADTDVSALAEGFITITPLHVDMTNHDRLAGLAALKWQPPG
jgi:5'-nucleotidase